MKSYLLFAAFLLCPAAQAQPVCPWLTEGTAAAMLDGPVTVTANLLPSGEGACTFTLQQAALKSLLEITVAAAAHPTCPADSKKLTGIGNEAVLCSPSETTDIVTSRVRNLYFTVRLTITGTGAPAISPAQRQSAVQLAAEEVAGNLY